jgi:hypothetical protein
MAIGSLLAGGVGVLVGTGVIAPASIVISLFAIAAIVALFVARRRHRTILHPCVLLGAGLCAYGILGFALYPSVYQHGPHPLMRTALSYRSSTLVVFLVFGLVLLGIAAVAPRGQSVGTALRIDLGTQSPTVRKVLFGFVIVVAAALVLGSNLHAILDRSEYRGYIGSVPEAYRFGDGLRIPALLCGWMFMLSAGTTRSERSWALLAIGVIVAMDFATASRGLAVTPLLFVLAYLLTRSRSERKGWILICAACLSFLCLSTALFLRTESEQGIVGYTKALITHPVETTTKETPAVVANALMGFPLAGYVENVANNATSSALLDSINPLPRRDIGRDPTAQLRVTSYMPYSSIGLLGAVGILAGVIYFGALGVMLSWLWVAGQANSRRAAIATPTLVGVAVVLGLMMVQYQLRTTTRIATVAAIGVPIMLLLGSKWQRPSGARLSQ